VGFSDGCDSLRFFLALAVVGALTRISFDGRAYRRKFEVLAVCKIDRFGRSLRHLVNALAELEAVGVAFVSLRDNLDLGTPSGRLLFQTVAAMAEFERTLIAERVRTGLANAKKKGMKLGRPRVMVDIERVAALRRSGASWQAISQELRVGLSTKPWVARPPKTFRFVKRRTSNLQTDIPKFPFPSKILSADWHRRHRQCVTNRFVCRSLSA
jgi:hypothetical protein